MWLNQYSALSGEFVKTLFEEKDEKYVEPLVPVLFIKNDASHFIWQSNRDGWNHLYLYDANGNLLKQLTKGSWEVLEVKGFDDKGDNLFYTATEESPITKNLYQYKQHEPDNIFYECTHCNFYCFSFSPAVKVFCH